MAAITQSAALRGVESDRVADENGNPFAHLSRLAHLHDEATETAHLSNLLGRVPYAGCALVAATGLVAFASHAGLAPLVAWVALTGAGIGAIARAYRSAIEAPFERESLRSFAQDLAAIMLYVGFAWGAGSFLAVGAGAEPLPWLLSGCGVSAAIGLTLRRWDAVVCFCIPAALLTMAAAIEQHWFGRALFVAAIIASGLLPVTACYLGLRLERRPGLPEFAAFSSN